MVTQTFDSRNGSKIAFLFPGQGSHQVGMGLDLYQTFDSVKRFFYHMDEALDAPLTRILFEGPEEELRKTVNAQPAILAVSLACLRAVEEIAGPQDVPQASLAAGHSLGEYTALVAAGALDPMDALRLVHERGRLMHEASLQVDGGMVAVIGLDEETAEEICRETGTQIANINSEEQIIISGERLAVAQAADLASARGAKRAIPLKVGGAFHSALMEPAVASMTEAIARVEIHQPRLPVVANCTGMPITSAEEIREELIHQICRCVQWRRSMDYMLNAGVGRFVEIGPGRVLSGLLRRMRPHSEVYNIGDVASLREFLA